MSELEFQQLFGTNRTERLLAFNSLYKKYAKQLLSYANAISRRDGNGGADVSSCYEKFWRNLDEWVKKYEEKLKADFFKFLKGCVFNAYRDRAKVREQKQDDIFDDSEFSGVDTFSADIENQQIIAQCLDLLKAKEKRIIQLWIEGYDLKETSQILGLSYGQVRNITRPLKVRFISCVKNNIND